jgi:uridine kinase
MHFTTTDGAIAAALKAIDKTEPRCGATKVVAIDGPSGSGKTQFAATLADHLQSARILHMEDLYPGWNGLEQAVRDLHDLVLAPLARGEQATYRRWDWEHDRYAGWLDLPPADLLLVEGVGSGAGPGAGLVSVLIWLEADRAVRFRRGIERDGDPYLPHWQGWALLEGALFERDGARKRADIVLDTTR